MDSRHWKQVRRCQKRVSVIYLIFYFHFIFAKSCLLVTFNFFSALTPLHSASLRLAPPPLRLHLYFVNSYSFSILNHGLRSSPYLSILYLSVSIPCSFCPFLPVSILWFPFYNFHLVTSPIPLCSPPLIYSSDLVDFSPRYLFDFVLTYYLRSDFTPK